MKIIEQRNSVEDEVSSPKKRGISNLVSSFKTLFHKKESRNETKRIDHFSHLPRDLLKLIISTLPISCTIHILLISKTFNQLKKDDDLWMDLFTKEWNRKRYNERFDTIPIKPEEVGWVWMALALSKNRSAKSSRKGTIASAGLGYGYFGTTFFLAKWNNGRPTDGKVVAIYDEPVLMIYAGDYQTMKRNGRGKLVYDREGYTYEGQWKNHERDGFGIQRWHNGKIYEGHWKDNSKHGFGKMIHPKGKKYEGEWKKDKEDGHGVFRHDDGSVYTGDMKLGKMHGKGTYIWAENKGKYVGDFVNNKREGFGTQTWADGTQIEGEWKQDRLNGEAYYSWPDAKAYHGSWKDGRRSGFGTQIWSDGAKYEGEWKHHKRHGVGTQIWPDGRRYEGAWIDDKRVTVDMN